jgi:hypothetical protein
MLLRYPHPDIESWREGRAGWEDGEGMLGWAEGVPAGSAGPRRSPAPIRRPGAGSLQRGTAALAAAKVRENLGYRAGVAGRHLKRNIYYSKFYCSSQLPQNQLS